MNPLKRILQGLNPKVFAVLGLVCGAVTLLIVGVMVLRDVLEDRNINKAEQTKMAYNIEQLDQDVSNQTHGDLLYFEDLDKLELDMKLYRETELPWSHKDVGEFWIPADRGDIDYFSEANHKLVWEILKNAP